MFKRNPNEQQEIHHAASAPPKNTIPPEHVIRHYRPNEWVKGGTGTTPSFILPLFFYFIVL
jgi:hypothetical protein